MYLALQGRGIEPSSSIGPKASLRRRPWSSLDGLRAEHVLERPVSFKLFL